MYQESTHKMWTAVTVISTRSGNCQGATGVLGDLQVTEWQTLPRERAARIRRVSTGPQQRQKRVLAGEEQGKEQE